LSVALPSLRAVDHERARRALDLFERRGDVEPIEGDVAAAAWVCLDRAKARGTAAALLVDAGLWDPAFTSAYDAYRSAADAVVLCLGYRVPAVAGAHRISCDIAAATVGAGPGPFSPASAERFRRERHTSEYFDPEHPVEKVEADARWALDLAGRALVVVESALSAG